MAQATIDRLIINSPYEELARYWQYERETRLFDLTEGRRPAGYVVASGNSKAFDDPGIFVEIPLVNRIRPRVKARRSWIEKYPLAEGEGENRSLRSSGFERSQTATDDISIGRLWSNLEELLVGCNCAFQISLTRQRFTQISVRRRIIGINLNRILPRLDGSIEIALHNQQVAVITA